MRKLLAMLAILALIVLPGCDSFVEGVDEPPDNIADEALNDASQVPFLIKGVQTRFAQSHDQATLLADLVSDAAVFGRNGDATFPTFRHLDRGTPTLDNNSVDNLFNILGEYRYLADNLIVRVNAIDALSADEGGFEDDALKNEALFAANLHGGIARYFMAAYFGLTPNQGGGVIDRSDFIPSAQMYDLALEKLDAALGFASTDYDERLVNSLKARIHLFKGEYDAAETAIANGFEEGDDPFQSLHSVQSSNNWYTQAGIGRLQVVLAERFRDYLEENADEADRVDLLAVLFTDADDGTESGTIVSPLDYGEDVSEPFQNLYPERGSPINLMTWQEVELMRAELDLRDGDAGAARTHINNVRESHGLDPVADDATIDLRLIAEERDKEMMAEGIRLIDQHRFDFLDWIVPDPNDDTRTQTIEVEWRFLPITQQERNDNPNFD